MSKTYGSKLNRWVMKPEQWFEYNQWYSCEDYWETNEQCDSSLIRSSGGWSCQSVNIHIRRTLQLDDDFIIYELPVANCQDHPISSSIIQCLPVANNMYIYIYTYIIYIYIYICIHSVCIYIYIYMHTYHWQLIYQLPIKYTSYNEATCDGRMHRACRRW